MSKAIILPYVINQNEPSSPYPEIFDIPDDTVERVRMLTALWHEIFKAEEDDIDKVNPTISYAKDGSVSYGDISITADDGECFLYVTYIDEEPQTYVMYEGESSYLMSGTREELDAKLIEAGCCGYDSPMDFYESNDMYFKSKPIDESRPFTAEEMVDRWV